MSENDRLKIIQKKLNFRTQSEFAAALGIKQGSLSDIYRVKGGIKVSDSIKRILNKEYSISIDWLETGVGEMIGSKINQHEVSSENISMHREVFDQITRLTETVLSQQRTIEKLTTSKKGLKR